jgi:toxin ParE1/3/4
MPGMGQQYESDDEEIVNIHKWPVKGFNNYLIFYRYDNETLEVLRAIYAKRNY